MDGQELKERRKKMGLTTSNLAHLMGVTEGAVYCWETGSRRISPARKSAFERIEAKLNKPKSGVV
jgi:DNA-binding transcriptional regulator YiaG